MKESLALFGETASDADIAEACGYLERASWDYLAFPEATPYSIITIASLIDISTSGEAEMQMYCKEKMEQ